MLMFKHRGFAGQYTELHTEVPSTTKWELGDSCVEEFDVAAEPFDFYEYYGAYSLGGSRNRRVA